MKNKKVVLPIVISVVAAVVVAIVVVSKRKFRRYELTDEGKKYLQIYKDEDGSGILSPYMFAKGATHVVVNPYNEKDLFFRDYWTEKASDIFIPIRKAIWDKSKKDVSTYPNECYILKDHIKI